MANGNKPTSVDISNKDHITGNNESCLHFSHGKIIGHFEAIGGSERIVVMVTKSDIVELRDALNDWIDQ